MAEKDGNKPHVNLIMIGQADHGKTTLMAAINHFLYRKGLAEKLNVIINDNLAYEINSIYKVNNNIVSGVPINTSQIEYQTLNRSFTHTDGVDYIDHIKTMITSPQIDGAIVVADATYDLMPETIEQIKLAGQIGIPFILTFINKVDLTGDPDDYHLLWMAIGEHLDTNRLDSRFIIEGSALNSLRHEHEAYFSIGRLEELIDSETPTPVSTVNKPFLMPVEKVSSIAGRGKIVMGKIETGIVNVGDEIIVLTKNGDIKSVVTGIDMDGKPLNSGVSGHSVELMLGNIENEAISKGDIVILAKDKMLHAKYAKFDAVIYMLSKDEGGRHTAIYNNYKPNLSIRGLDITGSIALIGDTESVAPGGHSAMTITLAYPVVVSKGLVFNIYENGRIVGAGKVIGVIS